MIRRRRRGVRGGQSVALLLLAPTMVSHSETKRTRWSANYETLTFRGTAMTADHTEEFRSGSVSVLSASCCENCCRLVVPLLYRWSFLIEWTYILVVVC